MLPNLHRRDFLAHSSELAAALAAVSVSTPLLAAEKEKAGGANDRLRVAVVGVRGRGMSHVSGFLGRPDVEIATICDCDDGVIGNAMTKIEAAGKAPRYEKDFRRLLDDKSIDIISIATPNHWHALMAVWAMQAGKDVYVEKPATHNVVEGQRMIEAARKFNRICQVGTQSRSNPGMRDAMQYIHDGNIGEVKLARGTCYKRRGSIGKVSAPQTPPKSCDYDLWCGPAPMTPLMRQKLHYDWHWVWETGNGDLGNQGVHEMDKARWGLGNLGFPKAVYSLGGRLGYIDDGETANTQICVFDYGDKTMIFEVRGLPSGSPYPKPLNEGAIGNNYVGNVFYGSKGTVILPNYSGGVAVDGDGKVVAKFSGGGDKGHFDNFLKAVRSRKVEDLNCDIAEGHVSAALCHLANISYRLGTPNPSGDSLTNLTSDKEVLATIASTQQHLKDNNVDLAATPMVLGRKLAFDPKSETFVDDKQANAMLTREYRKGYEMPASV